MSDETTRHYSGKSGSERAQRRRETLVESGLVLIADGGWRQLSIDGVCLHAGLHKRYFYESFENLDALGAAVVDALAAGFLHATGPILNSKRTIPELAHAVVDALVRYLTDNPRRARVLFGELTGSEAVTQQRKHAVRRIEAAVVQAATMIHGAGAAKDPIAGLAASVLVGGTGQAILDWLDGQLPMTREQFIDDLTSLWMITGEGAAAFGGKRQAAIG